MVAMHDYYLCACLNEYKQKTFTLECQCNEDEFYIEKGFACNFYTCEIHFCISQNYHFRISRWVHPMTSDVC